MYWRTLKNKCLRNRVFWCCMSIQIGSGDVSSTQFQSTTTERLILRSSNESNIIRISSDTNQCLVRCDHFSFGRSNKVFQLSDATIPLFMAQSNIGFTMLCPYTSSNVATFTSNVSMNVVSSTSIAIAGASSANRPLFSISKSDNTAVLSASASGLITFNPFIGIGTTALFPGAQLHVESNVFVSSSITTTSTYLSSINDRTSTTTIFMRPNNIEVKAPITLINGDLRVQGDLNVDGSLPFNSLASFNNGAIVGIGLTSVNINLINNQTVTSPVFNMQYGGNIDEVTSNIMSVRIRPSDSNISAFTMDNKGCVGFGSAVPSAIVDIFSTSNHNAPYNFRITDNLRPWNSFAIDCNANVGIGTNAPLNKLSITFPDNVPPTLYLEGCNAVVTVDSSNNSNVTSNAVWSYCNYASSAPIVNIANSEVYSFPNRPILVASCNSSDVFRIGSKGQVSIGINITSNIDERYAINVDPSWVSRIPSIEISNLYGNIDGQLTNLYNLNTVSSSNSYIGLLNTSNIRTKYIYAESYEILSMRCIESDPSLFEVFVSNFHFTGTSIIFASNYADRPTDPITGGKLKIVCEDPPVGTLSRGIVVAGTYDSAVSVQSYQSAPYYELVTRNNSARIGMLIDGTIGISQSADFSVTATPKFRILDTYTVNNTTYSTGAISLMANALFTTAGLNINQITPSFSRALQVSGDCIFTDGANEPKPVMFISGINGNPRRVGICTDSPLYNLDVQGTQNVTGAARFASTVGIGTAASLSDLLTIHNFTAANTIAIKTNNNNFFVDNKGNVGVGTQPRFSIDITGDINFTGGVYRNSLPYIQSQFTTGANGNIYIMQNLGIGITNPQYGLDVRERNVFFGCNLYVGSNIQCNGTVYARGSFITTSDRSVKTDLTPIPCALEKVSRLNGYTYYRTDTGKREAGLVAQEVQRVLPEVVSSIDSPLMSISYGNIACLFVEAIKELKNKIECLEAEVATLKTRFHT